MADGLLRVGVIGTGGMGGRHARNLAHRVTGAKVAAVMDADEARAAYAPEYRRPPWSVVGLAPYRGVARHRDITDGRGDYRSAAL